MVSNRPLALDNKHVNILIKICVIKLGELKILKSIKGSVVHIYYNKFKFLKFCCCRTEEVSKDRYSIIVFISYFSQPF
jgi:hypothetical protein